MTALLDAIRSKTDRALASGDLSPLETSETVVEQNGLRFIVRWAEALARKDAAKAAAPATAPAPAAGADAVILPGGPRDPNFNPFLNPDPALTVGPIGTQHTIVLNKFPVCLHHLVLARRDFAEQLTPLELCDFEVLAQLLCTLGGLGFYNGGVPPPGLAHGARFAQGGCRPGCRPERQRRRHAGRLPPGACRPGAGARGGWLAAVVQHAGGQRLAAVGAAQPRAL